MFEEMDYCVQCGEVTKIFADGLCSSCSLAKQQELDFYLEQFEEWNTQSDSIRDILLEEIRRSETRKEKGLEDDDFCDLFDEIPDDIFDEIELYGYE